MNALKNFSTSPELSIAICNSEHPIAKHASMTAKRIPGSEGLFYIRFKADEYVVTYRKADHTVAVHEMGFAEFKRRWEEQSLPVTESIGIPETDKYIGNMLWRLLGTELEPMAGANKAKGPAPSEVDVATAAAIMTNTKVWCRRFNVESQGEIDGAIAQRLAPTSVRRGAIALAAARASKIHGVVDSRERILIGWLVAAGIIYRLDNNGSQNDCPLPMDCECMVVWGKYSELIQGLIEHGWAVRAEEKSRLNLTNMILNTVRGK